MRKSLQKLSYLLLFAGVFFSLQCADRIVSECEQTGEESGILRARFSEIQRIVFTPTCAVSGCHQGFEAPLGLDLSAGKSYDNLVNRPSRQNPDLLLVAPNKSDQSYIIKKLRAEGTSVMPPSGMLDAALIDSIAAWIDRGAPKEN